MNGAPSSPVDKNNKFSCLEVEETSQDDDEQESVKVTSEEGKSVEKRKKRGGWEKKLLRAYMVASSAGSDSLHLKVQVHTTDTGEVHGADGLVDCGASGQFMDFNYVQRIGVKPLKLLQPIQVNNMDGTPNELGSIT